MSGIVQFTQLGKFGRFGNQLFQYAFARAYAEKHGGTLEIPENWIGKKIFKNIDHPKISKNLPRTPIDTIPNGRLNIDLFGYYQTLKSLEYLKISKLKEWFVIKEDIVEMFPKEKNFYISAHIRRGDYVNKYSNLFCIINETSYIKYVKDIGFLEDSIVWIREDNPKNSKFLSYDINFLEDFMTLLNSDILLRANSTFSFWAGILGKSIVYSPVIIGKVGKNDVDFVEGNWEAIVDQRVNKGTPLECGSLFINN